MEYLIDAYQKLVFSLCYKMTADYFTAEDLTQETFLSVYHGLDEKELENEKAWICKVAVNKCLDYLKKAERRNKPTDEEYFKELPSKEKSPEDICLEKEIHQSLLEACRRLKHPYDEIAEYYYYEGMDSAEIALKTGRNQKTVQTQIYRARALLRNTFGKESGRWKVS